MHTTDLPVVVVGAGPVGLAAAAHLMVRGLRPLVLEAGDVGENVRSWGHVRLFSPWRYTIDREAGKLLGQHGWQAPDPDQLPTGRELVERYLQPLARLPAVAEALHVRTRVVAITRHLTDKVRTKGRAQAPLVVRIRREDGRDDEVLARAVLDASGTWATPNPLGAAGLPAIGEEEVRQHIHYGIPDLLGGARGRYEGRKTLVVGSGHSAANTLLGLAELRRADPKTTIVWATRTDDPSRSFGGGEADGLPARGKLGSDLQQLVASGAIEHVGGFFVREIRTVGSSLSVIGAKAGRAMAIEGLDAIVAATGQRPDLAITRELRLELDPWLESAAKLGPLIDPNVHSCGTVRPHGALELAHPEPDFYVIGHKSYGRAPTFLLATGYEQARSVAAMLAGDREAAIRVELDLPETGVCSIGGPPGDGCCGPKPKVAEAAPRACCSPNAAPTKARACC